MSFRQSSCCVFVSDGSRKHEEERERSHVLLLQRRAHSARSHAKATTPGGSQAPTATAPLAHGESRVTIPVSGMHCSQCVSRVKATLTKMDGVKSVDADLDKGRAVVSFEKGKVDTSKMVEAIDGLGFKAGTPSQN